MKQTITQLSSYEIAADLLDSGEDTETYLAKINTDIKSPHWKEGWTMRDCVRLVLEDYKTNFLNTKDYVDKLRKTK